MNNIQKINELINKVGSYQKKAMINLQKNNFQQAQLQFNLLARSADELSYQCKLINASQQDKERSDDTSRVSKSDEAEEAIRVSKSDEATI